jgi:hypothetical protein
VPKEPVSDGPKPVRETVQIRPRVSTRKQIVFGLLALAALVLVLFWVRDVIGSFVLRPRLADRNEH